MWHCQVTLSFHNGHNETASLASADISEVKPSISVLAVGTFMVFLIVLDLATN